MRLLNWNLEFAPPAGPRGLAIAEVIQGEDAEVVCLTETHEHWPMGGGHWIWSDPDYGYEQRGDRRKVGLWSRRPWSDVDVIGDARLPSGRFVAGITETSTGPVRFVGVCIPWRAAHVSTGRRDREPWDDHVTYLRAMKDRIPTWLGGPPLVVVGDYNQRLPRQRAPVAVYEEIERAFASLDVVTSGPVPGLEAPVIDHVAVGPGLIARSVEGISRVVDDRRVSDHDGVVVDLATS